MSSRHLERIDLLERIRLGQNALIGGLDPTRRHLPYYNCGFNNGDLTRFSPHTPSDHHHHVARAILALCMAEEITGDRIDGVVFDDLTWHIFALFDEADDLPGLPKSDGQERVICLHDIREVTLALTALIQRGNERAEYWVRRMVCRLRQALDENGKIHLERLPKCLSKYTSQPHQEGRSVGALIHYYRVTGEEVALETAVLLTKYALEHCFSPDGIVTEEAGFHGHSINGLVSGMLELALITNDSRLLQRVKIIYDVGLPFFNSSFGFSRERLDEFNEKGEGNSSGDLLRTALLLGQAGFPEYFGYAERILRSHLLPSQVIAVEGFSDDAEAKEDYLRSMASRICGGFGFRTPNDLIVPDYFNPYMRYESTPLDSEEKIVVSGKNYTLIRNASVLSCKDPDRVITVYDVHSAVVEALCVAWNAILTEDNTSIRVNLLLSCEARGVKVRSCLSGEGRIDIENTTGRNVFVRIPYWVSSLDIELKIDGAKHPLKFIGPYLLVPGKEGHQTINIHFPMREERTEENISYKKYTIDWRGDQIVAMSPPGEILPMFPPCEENERRIK